MNISTFDWLVYRFFRWRWNPIFAENPAMLKEFAASINQYQREQEKSK